MPCIIRITTVAIWCTQHHYIHGRFQTGSCWPSLSDISCETNDAETHSKYHCIYANHHQQSSAVQQVFDNLSLCLHPSLSSIACLSAIKPTSFVKSCSVWIFLLPLVGLHFILPSIISRSPLCLETWPMHRHFLNQIELIICLSLFTLLRSSSLVTLSSQVKFSIHLHVTFQRLLIFFCLCVNIHISAAYSATVQTNHSFHYSLL